MIFNLDLLFKFINRQEKKRLFYRFIGFAVLRVVVNFVILPREERVLEARFGEVYRQYKRTVPRWLGKI